MLSNVPQPPPSDPFYGLPPELMRRYEIRLNADAQSKVLKMREVTAQHIGKLVSIRVSRPSACLLQSTWLEPILGPLIASLGSRLKTKFCCALHRPQESI